jgi:signal transduction histidine kinase
MERTRQTGVEVGERIDLAHERGDAPTRLLDEQETAVYRIVQEALTNIAKHARANRVQVEIVEGPSALRILVADDGVGFEPATRSDGFGLEGVRERVDLLDGQMRIVSAPAEGTEIVVTLPPRHRLPDGCPQEPHIAGATTAPNLRGAD